MIGAFGGASMARFVDGSVQLLIFAVVMLLAAVFIIRAKTPDVDEDAPTHAWWKIVLEGLVIGAVTGLVGVGGGFLIVPALAILGGLAIHVAIGTSLAIIALKSFVGFFAYMRVLQDLQLHLDWTVIFLFTLVGVGGSFLGGRLSERVPQRALRRLFATFLVVVGTFIMWDNRAVIF